MTILIIGGNQHDREKKTQELVTKYVLDPKYPDLLVSTSDDSGISSVRAWQSWLNLSPSNKNKRTLVITKAESLTLEAQSALLKTLEEPPLKAQIILVADSSELLLSTVISRCLIVDLGVKCGDTDPTDNDILEKVKILDTGSLGSKFALAQMLSVNRLGALTWLDKLALALRQNLTKNPKDSYKIRQILTTKKQISGNANVRLALENLFLKW